ncbi:MAG TPA: ABC transporter permease, partial [Bryobacteraceae bacterium]
MGNWLRKLRETLGGGMASDGTRAEMEAHLEFEIEERRERGMTAEEAREAALRAFGNRTVIAERTHETRILPVLETLLQDLRQGLRMLRRDPGLTAVAVLSLAAGIGANTAVFTVSDALILKKLPVREPERLVVISYVEPGSEKAYGFDYTALEQFRSLTKVFSDVSSVDAFDRSNLVAGPNGDVDTGQIRVALASGNYFSTMGAPPALGRAFSAEEDGALGAFPVAILSDAYWKRRFAGSPAVVGRIFGLGGVTFTIVGVAPPGFSGEWIGKPADLWIPKAMEFEVRSELPRNMGRRVTLMIARLKRGVRLEEAQAAAQVVYAQMLSQRLALLGWASRFPQAVEAVKRARLILEPAASGYSPQRRYFAEPLAILSIVVGLTLLIACANVAGLLLARGAARRREIAVRLAMGAARKRIVRQLITENVALALAGGAAGLIFARWGTAVLAKFAASGPVRLTQATMTLDLAPDLRMVAFTTAVCLLTALLFGLGPAFRTSNLAIATVLVERGAAAGGRRSRLGAVLVAVQVALSLVLLCGAGLFLRTVRNLRAQDLGFDRDRLLLIWANPAQAGRTGPSAAALYTTIEERLSTVAGVRAVSPSVYGMFQGAPGYGTILKVPGYTAGNDTDDRAQWSIVGTRYFETLGLDLLAGRNFTERDASTTTQVAIVNET